MQSFCQQDNEDFIPLIYHYWNRKAPPIWHLKHRITKHYDISYIYQGKGTYIINGVQYQVHSGDIVYIPMGGTKEAYADEEDPMHCYSVVFDTLQFSDETIQFPLKPVFHIGFNQELLDLYHKGYTLFIKNQKANHLEIKAYTLLILGKAVHLVNAPKEQGQAVTRIQIVQNYIEKHYNKHIVLQQLADLVHLKLPYFGTFFKKHTGYSVREYINRIRIHKAQELLSSGGFKVNEIANYCGYADVYYFSKVFKRLTGINPSNYIPD